jgi:adenylosuccinate synthase
MVQSEALKRAKAKYYQKKKLDPEFIKKNVEKAKEYFESHRDQHRETCKRYYEEHKDEITGKLKEQRDKKKLDDVKAKLEQIDTEQLAKILIEARKTKLLDIEVF